MAETYEDILNTGWGNIPRPKLLPIGSYVLKGKTATYQPPKSADKSPVVLFIYSVGEPMEDVDSDAFEALGSDYDPSVNSIFHREYVDTAEGWNRVINHLAKHGVNADDYDTKAEAFKAFRGTEVVAYLGQDAYVNAAGEQVVSNRASQFSPLE